jgi:hypothetical protein
VEYLVAAVPHENPQPLLKGKWRNNASNLLVKKSSKNKSNLSLLCVPKPAYVLVSVVVNVCCWATWTNNQLWGKSWVEDQEGHLAQVQKKSQQQESVRLVLHSNKSN